MNAKSIFLKYWFVGEPLLSGLRYYISLIPGLNEGVSGSMVAGCNVGIIKEIDPEKKDIAFEVVKYIVSKEYQREIFRSVTAITAVTELLDDPEICQLVPCEVIKKIQITGEPQFLREGPEDYRKQYQNYIYQYLYGKMPLEMTQKKIIDVTKIYDVGLGLENSALGLVVFILFMLLSSLMLLSLIFVFRDNFHPFFKFLHDDFWILTVLGSIVILCAPLVGYGQVNALKCHLQPCLISIGYTLSVGPTLHKLITQFPEKNKVVIWICKYRHTFIVMILILDVIMNGISFLGPFTAKLIVADNGEKFKICQSPGVYFMIILSTYKTLFTLLILFFIFVEWNTVAILYDVRFVVAAIYIDILSFILISVFHVIQINNYMTYFIIQTLNTSIIALSNYIILYGIRLMLAYIREHNIRLKFINTINENFINNEGLLHTRSNHHNSFNDTFSSSRHRSEMENQGRTMTSTIRRTNFISRMINYHNSNGMLSSDLMTVTTTTTSS